MRVAHRGALDDVYATAEQGLKGIKELEIDIFEPVPLDREKLDEKVDVTGPGVVLVGRRRAKDVQRFHVKT